MNIHNNPYFNDEREKNLVFFVGFTDGLHRGEPKINIIKKITTKAIKKLQSIFERIERLLDRKRRDTMQSVLKGQLTAGQLPSEFIFYWTII